MASSTPFSFDTSRRPVFVVGNEAADVDSLVSASPGPKCVLHQQARAAISGRNSPDPRYAMAQLLDSPEVQGIALAQIPREEFRLRADAIALFKEAGSHVLAEP